MVDQFFKYYLKHFARNWRQFRKPQNPLLADLRHFQIIRFQNFDRKKIKDVSKQGCIIHPLVDGWKNTTT